MAQIIYLDDLPDCEACQDPTKKRDGAIFDCPGPGQITPTFTCENEPCKRKYDAIAGYILRCEVGRKEE